MSSGDTGERGEKAIYLESRTTCLIAPVWSNDPSSLMSVLRFSMATAVPSPSTSGVAEADITRARLIKLLLMNMAENGMLDVGVGVGALEKWVLVRCLSVVEAGVVICSSTSIRPLG